MPVPPARRKKVMSMFPDQLDRAVHQDQPVSAGCVQILVFIIMILCVVT